jgi:hypothetical protein
VAAALIDDMTGDSDGAHTSDGVGAGSQDEPGAATNAKQANGNKAGRRTAKGKRGRASKAAAQAARTDARRANVRARAERRRDRHSAGRPDTRPKVYGDAAYGAGEFLDHLARHGIDSRCKTQPPVAPGGRFSKDRFTIDLHADNVTCPAGHRADIHRNKDNASTPLSCTSHQHIY